MIQEFYSNLQNDEAIVRGLRVDASEVTIIEVSIILRVGEEFLVREDIIIVKINYPFLERIWIPPHKIQNFYLYLGFGPLQLHRFLDI